MLNDSLVKARFEHETFGPLLELGKKETTRVIVMERFLVSEFMMMTYKQN